MKIEFWADGLYFEADVIYYRGSNGSWHEPPELASIDIETLTTEGSEALFLMGSPLFSKIIENSAIEAVETLEDTMCTC